MHNKTFNLQTTVSSYKCIPGRSQKIALCAKSLIFFLHISSRLQDHISMDLLVKKEGKQDCTMSWLQNNNHQYHFKQLFKRSTILMNTILNGVAWNTCVLSCFLLFVTNQSFSFLLNFCCCFCSADNELTEDYAEYEPLGSPDH